MARTYQSSSDDLRVRLGQQPQHRVTLAMLMAKFPLLHVERSPEESTGDAPAMILLHGFGADENDPLPYAEDQE